MKRSPIKRSLPSRKKSISDEAYEIVSKNGRYYENAPDHAKFGIRGIPGLLVHAGDTEELRIKVEKKLREKKKRTYKEIK